MDRSTTAALLECVYDAVLDDDGWTVLMGELASVFHGNQVALLSQDSRSGAARVRAHRAGVGERVLRDYETYYAPRSPLFHYFKTVRVGVPYTDADYPDQRHYRRSEIYNDFYLPLGAEHLLGIDLEQETDLSTYLIIRRGRDAGVFTAAERRRFAVLAPHIERALRLDRLVQGAASAADALDSVLTRLPGAVILTEAGGRVTSINPGAERLVAARDGLWLDHGRLRCSSPTDSRILERLIATAGRGEAPSEDRVIAVRRRSTAMPLMVEVLPLPSGRRRGSRQPVALLRIVDRRLFAPDPASVVRLLGLTPAEAALAVALCGGDGVADYASRTGISPHTARTLLRSAMAKTGTHRQAALVSLVLSSVWDADGTAAARGSSAVKDRIGRH